MNKIIYAIAFLSLLGCESKDTREIATAPVKRGTFTLEITEEGEIESTKSQEVNAPKSYRYGLMKITKLVEDGADVLEGDTLVVFDPSDVNKSVIDAESRLEINEAELEKMKAQHASELDERIANLEVAKIDHKISKIRYESSNYEADIKKREIKLNLDKADIALEKATEEIENRKKIQYEEVQQKMLWIKQAEADLESANLTLDQLILRSPAAGIAIVNQNWSSDVKFQIGDQVWSGYSLLELPDLSELKAKVKINEVDVTKVVVGAKVIIKLDAFSDSIYHGEIMSIANLAVNKSRDSKIKVFPVDILIKTNSQSLMPGLTVSCKIIIDEIDDVLSIPLEALHSEGDNDFVYIKRGKNFYKQKVTIGQSNIDFVLVTSGLDEGDLVALVDPFALEEENASSDKK